MSRIGKQPVKIPEKVKVSLQEGRLLVEGPLGKLEQILDPLVSVDITGGSLLVKARDATKLASCRQGLMRNLIRNRVEGVAVGYKKELEINGVGFRAEVKGQSLVLNLGFSHPVEFPIPAGIKVHVEKQTRVQISGAAKDLVGETASRIRKLRPPEPYKGKGIKYVEEVVRRKVGKAAVTAGGK